MRLADLLAFALKVKNWSPAQLAARSNQTEARIKAILDGADGTMAQRIRIAKALGLDATDLDGLPTPELDHEPEWLRLKERLYKWNPQDRQDFLVVCNHMAGKEEAALKRKQRT